MCLWVQAPFPNVSVLRLSLININTWVTVDIHSHSTYRACAVRQALPIVERQQAPFLASTQMLIHHFYLETVVGLNYSHFPGCIQDKQEGQAPRRADTGPGCSFR